MYYRQGACDVFALNVTRSRGIALQPRGEVIAVASEDAIVLLDADSLRVLSRAKWLPNAGKIVAIEWRPDSTAIAILTDTRHVVFYSLVSKATTAWAIAEGVATSDAARSSLLSQRPSVSLQLLVPVHTDSYASVPSTALSMTSDQQFVWIATDDSIIECIPWNETFIATSNSINLGP